MKGLKYVYELCECLPRSGPGDNLSTARAYQSIPNPPQTPYILDIGCGQGMQTLELARLSKGKIIALDNHQGFLDIVNLRAHAHGLQGHITTTNQSMDSMDFQDASFDIIWSEGALYCMGFKNGLKRCHELLKPDGHLAVTELVYLVPDPPVAAQEYIGSEYPDISDVPQKLKLIEESGYKVHTHFTLPTSSWLDPYYLPIEKELPRFINKHQGNKEALEVFEMFRFEVEQYKKFSHVYGYEFFVAKKL